MIGISGTFPLNKNRGRATLQCVWSIHRIDKQLGRLLDINSAWRDPIEQQRLYDAYRRYVNGTGPWAPIALTPEQSVHCDGEAIDTDDNNAAMTRILNDNGWFHTVFRGGVLVEPWHYEYDFKRDKYFTGSPAGEEEEDMTPEQDARLERIEAWINGALSSSNQTAMFQNVATLRAALLNGRPEYYEGKYSPIDVLLSHTTETKNRVRGPKSNVDMLQDILGKLEALNTRVAGIEGKLPK